MSKKRIVVKGEFFNRIEKLGGREYNHIGFEDEKGSFGDLIATIVPKVGDRKKVKLIIEVEE